MVGKACGQNHRPREVGKQLLSLRYSVWRPCPWVAPPYSGWAFPVQQDSSSADSHRAYPELRLLGAARSLQADREGEEGMIGRFLVARLLPPNITPKVEEGWSEKIVLGEGGYAYNRAK